MGIFDGIQDEIRRGPLCRMYVIAAKLDKNDLKALADVLADEGIPGSAIARRLNAAGHKIGADGLQRHRRGLCSCKS